MCVCRLSGAGLSGNLSEHRGFAGFVLFDWVWSELSWLASPGLRFREATTRAIDQGAGHRLGVDCRENQVDGFLESA